MGELINTKQQRQQQAADRVLPPTAAVLVADDDARFQEVNQAATRLLKYSEEELKRLRVWDITVGAQVEEARLMWKEFISHGRQSGVYQVRRSDGRQVTVQYEATANVRPGRHISILQPIARAHPESRPLDECPFERPFPEDFTGCPAYQPRIVQMTDSREQPVGQVWTCDHLAATKMRKQPAYYARCAIGDAMERSRWLTVAQAQGLTAVRTLRIAFSHAAQAEIRQLIAAQASYRSSVAGREGLQRLQAAGELVLAALAAFVHDHRDALRHADVDPGLLQRCFAATLADGVQRRETQGLRPPARLLAGYPLTIRAFLRPDLAVAGLLASSKAS